MKPRIFRNQRVMVMGLGLHGGGLETVRFLLREGAREILVTDLRSKKELGPTLRQLPRLSRIRYVLGKHRYQDFKNRDAIIKNPGVDPNSPYLKYARAHQVPVLSDIGIFFERASAPIIGVTGTKGKSSTSFLISLALKAKFRRVLLAGNIRTSVLGILDQAKNADVVILELSSFQLEDMRNFKQSPKIAVITNIFPDHLNRHGTMRAYSKIKSLIAKYQGNNDVIIFPKGIGIERILPKTSAKRIPAVFNEKNRLTVSRAQPLLLGHFADAAILALAVAKVMGIPKSKALNQFRRYKPLEGRMEIAGRLKSRTFINDTTATTPIAAERDIAILRQRYPRVILIAGGKSKKTPYENLARVIKQNIAEVIFLPGDATDRLAYLLKNTKIPQIIKPSMQTAVKYAYNKSCPGDAILLSPGAASFGLFKHEFHRGAEFIKSITKLK